MFSDEIPAPLSSNVMHKLFLPLAGVFNAAIAMPPPAADVSMTTFDKFFSRRKPLKTFKLIWSGILLASLLTLAGCPEVAQQPGGGAGQQSGSGGSMPD